MKRRLLLKWFLPLALMILWAPFSAQMDFQLSNLFFSKESLSFSKAPYHYYIYNWAVIPALATAAVSTVLFLLSYIFPSFKKIRFDCLFLSLSMGLGAGIMTHLVFKEFWFRPRPVQTLMFGGIEQFRPFYLPKFAYPNLCKSFPSGHATMGFYFLNLIWLGMRSHRRWLVNIGIVSSTVMSFLLGFSRIAQGGHFLSDVLMSLIVTWYAALIIDKVVFDYLAKNKALSYIKD